ncbi:pyrophosphatase [Aureococcus anophagefferens]|nr:pyrophosphatase [Aureococcus anophagefferens]
MLNRQSERVAGARALYDRASYAWPVDDFEDWEDAVAAMGGSSTNWRAVAENNTEASPRRSTCALEPSLLWIPYGEDYGGLCDRFLVAPSDLVLQALDIMRPVVSFPDRYFDFVGNPEMLFRRRLAEMRLLRRTARASRGPCSRAAAKADHSRWSQVKGCVDDPAPICFKYAGEYEAAMRGCGLDDPRGRVSVPTWSDGFFHNGKWSNSTSDIWGDDDVE